MVFETITLGEEELLTFSKSYKAEAFHLFSLPPEVEEVLLAGEELCFKGASEDSLVCCSTNRTYNVRKMESSNTSMIMQRPHIAAKTLQETLCDEAENASNLTVLSTVGCSFELVPTKPKLNILHNLLWEHPFTLSEGVGCIEEPDLMDIDKNDVVKNKTNMYSFDDLLQKVQSSATELRKALKQEQAFKTTKGHWRVVSLDALNRIFSCILDGLDENCWVLSKISESSCAEYIKETLGELPLDVVRHVLSIHSILPIQGDSSSMGIWNLDPKQVAVFRGRNLLCQNVDNLKNANFSSIPSQGSTISQNMKTCEWELEKFMEEWKSLLPVGVEPFPEMLQEFALFGTKGGANHFDSKIRTIRPLPIKYLASSAEDRMNQLFGIKKKWSLEELRPFIKDLTCTFSS